MRTLIAILVLFFSTSTFVNHAKSLEYTVLTDAEVEYLLQTYTDINDLWYGIYVYDSEDKEEKLGYMHLWNEMESSFSSYNKPVFIEKTDTHFEMFTGEVTEILMKRIEQLILRRQEPEEKKNPRRKKVNLN